MEQKGEQIFMIETVIGNLRQALKSPSLTKSDFANLYEKHIGTVFNYCLFRVGDSATAEDLTAETFERAWRNRTRYRPEKACFTTWLYSIARHLIIDKQRQNQRHPVATLNERQLDVGPSIELQVEQNEKLVHLHNLVQSLDEYEQELIALKFGAGLTNKQIGQILNKSESAIGSALHRVMKKLRQDWNVSYVDETNA